MKKKLDPFKNLKLDPYEQEIEDGINRGDYQEIPLSKKEREEFVDAAAYTLQRMKKDRRVNIRVKNADLNAIQQKALANGLPYQTLISTLLHHFAQGKISITL